MKNFKEYFKFDSKVNGKIISNGDKDPEDKEPNDKEPNDKKPRQKLSKREKIMIGIIVLMFFAYSGASSGSSSHEKQVNTLKQQNEELNTEVNNLEGKNEELQAKIDEASPWFEMKEEERKAEEEKIAKEKAEKEAKEEAEQKAQEKAEKEAQAKKEKQGYNTGITYSKLARNPDKYEGKKVKFKGQVMQISEGLLSNVIRLAVGGDYDKVLYLNVSESLTEERILEDDWITIYGVSDGIETYTTVMGANVSIPSVDVDKVDM